jgi:hypothetical protein
MGEWTVMNPRTSEPAVEIVVVVVEVAVDIEEREQDKYLPC